MTDNLEILVLETKLQELDKERSTIQAALNRAKAKTFATHVELQAALKGLEASKDWAFNESGDLDRYVRIDCLKEFADCRDALEAYLLDECVSVDWSQEVLLSGEGEIILIASSPDDRAEDRGVWQDRVLIIPESKYTLDGEINERIRNRMIEEHMTRTGFYPGVFEQTLGEVRNIDTNANIATAEELAAWKKKESEE